MGHPAVRRTLLAGAVTGALVLGTACAKPGESSAPHCTGRINSSFLVAQSVPTAERVPCIAGYPVGWRQGRVEVRNGRTTIALHSDRAGRNALRVALEPSCDTSGAVEVPSDEPGTVRHDRMIVNDGEARQVRTYGFRGGCVTYRFGFTQQDELTNDLTDEAGRAVGFLTRTEIEVRTRAVSNGKVRL